MASSRFAEEQALRKRQYVDELIEHFTGLDSQDDEDVVNFQAALEFVYSNLDYHRFLTTDPKQIEQTLTQLGEKFEIHGLTHRYDVLRYLLHVFMASPVIATHSEVHQLDRGDLKHDVLRFLLALCERPTRCEYEFEGLPVRLHDDTSRLSVAQIVGERFGFELCL